MKKFCLFLMSLFLLYADRSPAQSQSNTLQEAPYQMLPLGKIKPKGWLRDQLMRMKTGLTGNLDQVYPTVAGKRNAWLGGDGDAWERGPYWIDGLLPLAYILDDATLIKQVKPWVEWTLTHQREDGYIGPLPVKNTRAENGIQKEPAEDWWPRMVMLKILQQYFSATGDKRVITVLDKYFRYQLKELPKQPLDKWSFWANQRGADNMMVVYWLHNITKQTYLLELADLLYKQTYPFTQIFQNSYSMQQKGIEHLFPYNAGNTFPFDQNLIAKLNLGQFQSFHTVNLAQGIKTPVVYYQQHRDSIYLKAVKKALNDLDIFHGQAQGMYGGDEPLHGNNPTQGVEFCSVVEMMFSLETMLAISGDTDFADRLEKIAYNALPTQATDDFNQRQYFQSANQVLITRANRNFIEDNAHSGTDLCFGVFTGYTCCTSNMHQGWPKLVQNLWYATKDKGLAALIYGPSSVSHTLNGQEINIQEETNYPFNSNIKFTVSTSKKITFPFHLRIPKWTKAAQVKINGIKFTEALKPGDIIKINRSWKNGDVVELNFPMHVETSRWAELSVAVERGPLVYALKIGEDWRKVKGKDFYGDYFEVFPTTDWNYGLMDFAINHPETAFEVTEHQTSGYPWNLENTPLSIKVKGKKIPSWQLYNNMAGPLPNNFNPGQEKEPTEITLVPYGCSTLRITQFPVVH